MIYSIKIFKQDGTFVINHVKIFKKGDLMFEYKDNIIDGNTFIRSLNNKKINFYKQLITGFKYCPTLLSWTESLSICRYIVSLLVVIILNLLNF